VHSLTPVLARGMGTTTWQLFNPSPLPPDRLAYARQADLTAAFLLPRCLLQEEMLDEAHCKSAT